MPQAPLRATRGTAALDLRLGEGHRKAGRWSEAAYCYRSALEQDPDNHDAALGLGIVLTETGKLDAAIAVLERAAACGTASAQTALGRAFDRALRRDDAVTAFEAALALAPADHAALMGLGQVLDRLGRRDDLTIWLEAALQAAPDDPVLHRLAGGQHHAFGRSAEAIAAFARALALAPKDGANHTLLSEAKQYRPDDPHLAAMEDLAGADDDRPPEDRSALRFALAKAYADLGRDAEAFDLLCEANRLRRGLYVYDIAGSLAELERVARFFTPEFMAAQAGGGDASERPVFVIGVMRSGTTLVERILSAHPQIRGIGETPDLRLAVGETATRYPEQLIGAGAPDLRRIAESYLRRSGAAAGDALRVIDKTLNNDIFTALIHLVLPRARIVHVLRDPVDTCLSIFATNFGQLYPFSNDLGELGRYYRAQREMMAQLCARLPPAALIEVRYEDIVADIEGQTRRMLGFCGLAYDPACLSFHRGNGPVATASAAQVRRPLYASSVRRWRPPADRIKPLLDGLGPYAAAG